MKCYICDKELTEKEIDYNEQLRQFEPCPTCLEISIDAAYSDGFSRDDDSVEVLDGDYELHIGNSEDIVNAYEREDTEE